ncbi:MAG: ATP12 family protein [Pseudomonadota bacterium]
MKRFYDAVSIGAQGDGWQVMLDGRGVKTVRGADQRVPTQPLARALANEWDSQGETLNLAAFPLRGMADYAIDVVSQSRAQVAAKLVAYADTDTLLYRADPDEALYARQQAEWEPILTAFEARLGITLKRVSGIIHAEQDAGALAQFGAAVEALEPFTLTGLEAMTTLAASLSIGLSALEADADAETLWRAACLEEEWQAEQWGRDEEAEERRARRTVDFLRAAEFARLARL